MGLSWGVWTSRSKWEDEPEDVVLARCERLFDRIPDCEPYRPWVDLLRFAVDDHIHTFIWDPDVGVQSLVEHNPDLAESFHRAGGSHS